MKLCSFLLRRIHGFNAPIGQFPRVQITVPGYCGSPEKTHQSGRPHTGQGRRFVTRCQVDDFDSTKYHGSGEQCAKMLDRFASEPLVEKRKLFIMLLFSWWVLDSYRTSLLR